MAIWPILPKSRSSRLDNSPTIEDNHGESRRPTDSRSITGKAAQAGRAVEQAIRIFCESTKTLRMKAGDIYIDGLTEATDRNGNQYGTARISRLALREIALSPEDFVKACVNDL